LKEGFDIAIEAKFAAVNQVSVDNVNYEAK
jgi:hypothetical protein